MKSLKFIVIIVGSLLSFESCGPVIISSRPSHPTPAWFYPNRVVNVRYIYFPEYYLYYDLTLRQYIYLNNNTWVSVKVLPQRFNTINLRRAKQERINNYYGDNIREYHSTRRTNNSSTRSKLDNRSRRG
ncbi:hypothetical protein HNV10_15270 [Winogradskyella litoriviva]|uniref:Uncharacterized protein n=1 Tax=Winogradskyella litoriviva TaxID=1220182 RepID=A0ABX2E7X6_9FLAO|nr:hypothetical protein [Winogradskyella litoriviva]NRD24613.1 hypothetical protein [Winogradskyella litoriviva]